MSVVASELAARVGALLDVTIDTSSGNEDKGTPSYSQVRSWLYDAARQILHLAPEPHVAGFVNRATSAGVTSTWAIDGIAIERILSVIKGGFVCDKVSYSTLRRIPMLMPSLYSGGGYAYAESGSIGEATLQFYPEDSDDVEVAYVAPVAQVASWVESPTDNYIPPDSWSKLMVDYAVIQGKVQDEEPEQVQLLMQLWVQGVQAAFGGGVSSGELGGRAGAST